MSQSSSKPIPFVLGVCFSRFAVQGLRAWMRLRAFSCVDIVVGRRAYKWRVIRKYSPQHRSKSRQSIQRNVIIFHEDLMAIIWPTNGVSDQSNYASCISKNHHKMIWFIDLGNSAAEGLLVCLRLWAFLCVGIVAGQCRIIQTCICCGHFTCLIFTSCKNDTKYFRVSFSVISLRSDCVRG